MDQLPIIRVSFMPLQSRRRFLMMLPALAGLSAMAPANADTAVQETDLLARTLDYVGDTNRAKQSDYPSHNNQQMCRRCKSYRGDPTAASGPCKTFNNQIVSTSGWCSAFEQKPDNASN